MNAMSGPKIFILVLVAVAVIFAVTVGVGSWPGRVPKFDPSSPNFKLDNLKETWLYGVLKTFPSKSLDQKRICSECFSEGVFTIPENQPECEVDILEGKASICDFKLKLVEGEAKLSYEPSPEDKNAPRIKERYLALCKPSITLQISKKGGKLTLTNEGHPSQPCRIEIIEKSEGEDS